MQKDVNQKMTEPITLSVIEMAKLLKISKNSAYKLCHQNGFPAIRINNKRILVIREQLEKWLENQSLTALNVEG